MPVFKVIITYEDGARDSFLTDQFDSIESVRQAIFSGDSPLSLIPSGFGGYLFDRQRKINDVRVQERTLGGYIMDEHQYDSNGQVEGSGPIEPEIMEEESDTKSDVVVYGEVTSAFESFREKFVNSARSQASFMNQIVEKMVDREELLQKAHEQLADETSKLEKFIHNKVGK